MRKFITTNLTAKAVKAFVVLGLSFLVCQHTFAQATADAGLDQTICSGNTVTIGGAPTGGGGGPYTYAWSPGIGLSDSTVSNPVANPTATTSYTVTVTCCSGSFTASDVMTVNVNPTPSIGAASNSPMCDGGALSLTTTNVSGASYFWQGPNGFTSSLQSPIINPVSPAAAGTYTLTVTLGACNNYGSANVVINPVPFATIGSFGDVSCNGLNNGYAKVITTGGTTPYLYYWDDPMNQTTDSAINLPPGTVNVYVSDVNGCNASASVGINEPAAITMSVFSPTACMGESATINPIVTGGVLPYSYVWDQGGTFYYTPTLTLSPTSSVTFTLNVTDANGCNSYAYPGITINPLTEIYGTVDYSGGPLVNGGTAVLFNWYPNYTMFDTAQVYTINASGSYFFSPVAAGNYLIKVFPDTTLYPLTVPTYFGDQYLWTMAQVKNHGCVNIDTANIFMVEGVTGVGPGMLHGTIFEGPGFGRLEGDPIPGIDIKLGRNPGGALVSQTTTNATGEFTFNNVDINNAGEYYTVYVDLPGRDRDSVYNVVITASNTTYNQLDHIADSNSVYPVYPVVTAISNTVLLKENKFTVYPNPYKGITTISYSLQTPSDVKLDVYNLLGVKMHSIVNTNQQAGDFKYNLVNEFTPGVYFISLTVNGNTSIQRVVKVD